VIKRRDHQVFHHCNLEELEVVPRRTYGFVLCVVLAGKSEELAGLRVLEGARCRYCGTE